ncbi:MAG: class I adenylate-forming enzyme family protein [Pseudomonadota bacterium]
MADATVDTHVQDFCQQAVEQSPDFAVTEATVNGVTYPVFANAPPTFAALYDMAASLYADQDFLVYHDSRMTFAEANAQSLAIAQALLARGIKPGEPIAIAMRNYPEWMLAYMAITRIGAVAVPMNGWWQTSELDYAFADSKARWVFADQQRADRLLPIAGKHDLQIVTVRGHVDAGIDWDALIAEGTGDAPLPVADTDAPATIFYTSGSTGNPKGVITTHRATLNALMCWALLTTADRTVRGKGPAEGRQYGLILTIPLFHVTGCNAMFLLSVLAGQKIVIMDRWNPEEAVRLIEKERITAFNGVPSMSFELAKAARELDCDISSLYQVSGGGAARPASHVPLIAETFDNVMPSIGYGMTETSALGTANAGNNYQVKPNSVGTACFPLVDLRIVREDGSDCDVGEPGEIWMKSVANMQGYLNKPEATAEVLEDGYMKSGDVGYRDEDGFVFLVDRMKDIVIRGGENISCQEVEEALYAHEAVHEAAVFGLPDEKLGEKLVAVVMVTTGGCCEQTLQGFLKDRVAYYKVPVHIEVRTEALPKTASAKIFKRALREAALQQANA